MKTLVTSMVVALVLSGSAALAKEKHHEGGKADATAKLESKSDSKAMGTVTFKSEGGKVHMKVEMTGLTPGEHAIHIHEKGDCSAPDASSAGGHWNPTTENHGKWGTAPFHHGDIGNLTADASGKATLTFSTDLWTIGDGKPSDIVGKAVVVHLKEDDFKTQPSGNAGGRVACGVISK
ncbi:MAG TPA: superoxide dismutase family protein [Candidatus Polarisedimenticolaceae bacterium]|nr:superoxide dismutase family protein [Candidatus Polarisedimenticolaceae bacterium]